MKFSHLHVHTQYSLLDGASSIGQLYDKAIQDGMPAMAISDHGNLFGAFEFVAEARKRSKNGHPPVKPIVGCEFYLTNEPNIKGTKKKRYHQLLLCKNKVGYQNLLNLSHYSYTEGMYHKPCINKSLLRNHKEGLIATSCCLAASIPQTLLQQGSVQAESELKWWLDLFGEDYYLELQRHGINEQELVNSFLIEMSSKYNIPLIATNDVHYVEKKDASIHEVLLCVNTGSYMSDPKKEDETLHKNAKTDTTSDGRKVRYRFAFRNDEFYFKTTEEITALFHDVPQAIDNTNALIDKTELLSLEQDILLPTFPLPHPFTSQHSYLVHLVWQGLRTRYTILTPEVEKRAEFELSVIEKMNYSGYFLIIADCIEAVKKRGVAVGPGRGSAAGSLVAYAIGITNIDPLKYNLLFERFLNLERRGMPDIDTDFDDIGRSKVIDYIVERYGKNQSAQIVTFNKMGAKGAVKDVARVYEMPYSDSMALGTLISAKTSVRRQLEAPLMHEDDSLEKIDDFKDEEVERAQKLRSEIERDPQKKKILSIAKELDGTIRNVGVHAAGIIIAPRPIQELIPVCTVKDSEMLVSQIEGKHIEQAGILKMDILGLSNLSQIKAAVQLAEKRHNKQINIDDISLDDKKTFQLYQNGDTVGTFQFESPGMRKYLCDLQPDKFEDLIALNALYRPGPMQYIPEFIKRKKGLTEIVYDLPEMKDILQETYGITVYQEQVMLLAQILAGFSKGEADVLRKAMGKKKRSVLEKMKNRFKQGAIQKGHPVQKIDKIWKNWESFAQYAFNKSHSTCYAYIAYQTAYLKANYPREFITALLEGARDIKALSKVIQEAKRMKLSVLGPDVNESDISFSITEENEIRFGLASIKGLGEQDATAIIKAREKAKRFENIYHFMQCMKGHFGAGKIEALVKSGGLDCFSEISRSQYFENTKDEVPYMEVLARYSKAGHSADMQRQPSLFSQMIEETLIVKPPIPQVSSELTTLTLLRYEREMVGTYISKHPLAGYQFEFDAFQFTSLAEIEALERADSTAKPAIQSRILIGGLVESVEKKVTKRGSAYFTLSISDFEHTHSFSFFGNDREKIHHLAHPNTYIYIFLAYVQDRFQPNRYRMQIERAGNLEDFKAKYTKEIHLYVSYENIDQDFLYFLEHYIKKHGSGKIQLYIHTHLKDMGDIKLLCNRSILFSNELVEFIQENKNRIQYKVVF